MDDSTGPAVLAALGADLARLLTAVVTAEDADLEVAERLVRDGVLAIGAQLLSAGLAVRGTGKVGPRHSCPCGGTARFEGYRPKEVQTLVGWVAVRRAYYVCRACGRGQCPLDRVLGLGRDGHSPGVRRLTSRCGGLLPFAPAAALLAEAAGVRLSPGTVRTVTEAAGARQDAALAAEIERAWQDGLPPATADPPERLVVALDGVRILGTDGLGREIKVGVIRPTHQAGRSAPREPTSYVAGLESADMFGRRVLVEAHRRGLEGAREVAVLGDGAAWIWNLAAEHLPHATCIVDWYHASERVWALGRALHGEGTPQTATWVEGQLRRLAAGDAAILAAEWQQLSCRGEAALVRDEQVTYFTNQAGRMAYEHYRAAGWDIGSGMVEGACKHLIGAREKGPGMRWTDAGAHAVAQVRILLCTGADDLLATVA